MTVGKKTHPPKYIQMYLCFMVSFTFQNRESPPNKKHPKNTPKATATNYFQALSFRKEKHPYHLNEPSLGSRFFSLPLEATIPPLLSWPTTKTSLPHRFVLSFKQRRSGKPCFCEFTETIHKWECCGCTYSPLNSTSDLNADFGRIHLLKYLSSWLTGGLVAIKIEIQRYPRRTVEKDWNSLSTWLFGPITGALSINNTVDGKDPALLRIPQMLVLYQYHDLLRHPKWCRIFFHQPYIETQLTKMIVAGCPIHFFKISLAGISENHLQTFNLGVPNIPRCL